MGYAMSLCRFALVSFAVACFGCTPEATVVARTEVGNVLDATNPTNAWNDPIRTVIRCEKAVVIAEGLRSVTTGRPAAIAHFSNGEKYLFIKGEKFGIRIF